MDLSNENKVKIKEIIVEEYINQGKTYRDVCKTFDIGLDTFHRLLKKYNIPARKVGKRKKRLSNPSTQ